MVSYINHGLKSWHSIILYHVPTSSCSVLITNESFCLQVFLDIRILVMVAQKVRHSDHSGVVTAKWLFLEAV